MTVILLAIWAFVTFVIVLSILEKMGLPRVWIGYVSQLGAG